MSSTSTMRAKARFFDAHGQFGPEQGDRTSVQLHFHNMTPRLDLDATIITKAPTCPPTPQRPHLFTSAACEPRVRTDAEDPGRPNTAESSLSLIRLPLHPLQSTYSSSVTPTHTQRNPHPRSQLLEDVHDREKLVILLYSGARCAPPGSIPCDLYPNMITPPTPESNPTFKVPSPLPCSERSSNS